MIQFSSTIQHSGHYKLLTHHKHFIFAHQKLGASHQTLHILFTHNLCLAWDEYERKLRREKHDFNFKLINRNFWMGFFLFEWIDSIKWSCAELPHKKGGRAMCRYEETLKWDRISWYELSPVAQCSCNVFVWVCVYLCMLSSCFNEIFPGTFYLQK